MFTEVTLHLSKKDTERVIELLRDHLLSKKRLKKGLRAFLKDDKVTSSEISERLREEGMWCEVEKFMFHLLTTGAKAYNKIRKT